MTDEVQEPQDSETENEGVAVETLTPDQRTALTLMAEVCAASGLECHPIVASLHPPYIHIDLVGGDVRMTWGRMGQSLDALQFLCNLILSHRTGTDVRIVLDADNYRQRREDALRIKATELAREVKSRNEEAELEPLPAHERRIIHSILAEDPDISTYSEGDEPDRRVIIAPRR